MTDFPLHTFLNFPVLNNSQVYQEVIKNKTCRLVWDSFRHMVRLPGPREHHVFSTPYKA